MRYALIIAVGACYYLGWLPASLAVPTLLAFSLLRAPTAGQTRRHGGFIHPSAPASSTASPTTAERVATYTSSPPTLGNQWEVTDGQAMRRALSRIGALGDFTPHATGVPGAGGTDASWEDILSRPGATTQSTRSEILADGTVRFTDSADRSTSRRVRDIVRERGEVSNTEVKAALPDANPRTVDWALHSAARKGLIRKTEHGFYAPPGDCGCNDAA